MENFWIIDCVQCGQPLRLRAEDNDLGRTVEVICSKCQSRTLTTIGVPVAPGKKGIPISVKEKFEAMIKKILADQEISDLAQSLQDDGYESLLVFMPHKLGSCDKEPVVNPKVDGDGEIVVGTFSKEDEEKFRDVFKIKL